MIILDNLIEARGVNSPRFDLQKKVDYLIENVIEKCIPYKLHRDFKVSWVTNKKGPLGFVRAIRDNQTGKADVEGLYINDMYAMVEEQMDEVILHELVHVLMYQLGVGEDDGGYDDEYDHHGHEFKSFCHLIEDKFPQYVGRLDLPERNMKIDYAGVSSDKTNPFYVVLVDDKKVLKGYLGVFGCTKSNEDGHLDIVDWALLKSQKIGSTRSIWVFLTDKKVFKQILPKIARKIELVSYYTFLTPEVVSYFKELEKQFVIGAEVVNGKLQKQLVFKDIEWKLAPQTSSNS